MKAAKGKSQPSGRKLAKGFDFGSPCPVLLPGATDWCAHLHDAEITGCAYTWVPIPELRARIPGIALIARKVEPLRQAFQQFHRWSEGSDDDAVELSIVFLANGGYLLGISPEATRWAARTTASQVMLDPLMMVPAWIKPLDTMNPLLQRLREYRKRLVAPIALDAAQMPTELLSSSISPTDLRVVSGLEPLVKFQCHMVHENDPDLPGPAELVLATHRATRIRRSGRPPSMKNSPADWVAKRRRVMDELFPLTLFRGRRSGLFAAVREGSGADSLRQWQIDQAVANIVLSRKVCAGAAHYVGCPQKNLRDTIVGAARDHVEVADGVDTLVGITPEQVLNQVALDARYLLAEHGEKIADAPLAALLLKLRRRKLLADA